jgi:hypothetical protein
VQALHDRDWGGSVLAEERAAEIVTEHKPQRCLAFARDLGIEQDRPAGGAGRTAPRVDPDRADVPAERRLPVQKGPEPFGDFLVVPALRCPVIARLAASALSSTIHLSRAAV